MNNIFQKILDVNTADPDDARRGKLLNVLLLGVFVSAVTGLVLVPVALFLKIWILDIPLLISIAIFTIIPIFLYFINQRSGKVAAFLFLLLLTIGISFSDSPSELIDGRSLVFYSIPIAIASLILRPITSFVFAIISTVILFWLGTQIPQIPNLAAIIGLFMLALVSWLSSRSLEQALRDLRVINAELDHRVEDRTRELSAALAREMVEAGKIQAILEGIADGVIVFDPDGKSIVANPALSYLMGIPVSDLMGVPMDSILKASKTSKRESESILSMLSSPSKDIPNVRFRWGNRTLLVNAAPVQTGLGDSIGTVAVFRDFTREAEVEQMKNTFVGMVSHELRTPLNAIIGYAEMVRESVYGPITQRQVGIMDRIENSGNRLLSLVSDLLDQAQIDAGRMKIYNAEFKVSDLVDTLHILLDKQINDKGLSLSISVDPNMPATVNGDVRRLQQILLNLVGNAIKFTPTGGINVHVHRVDGLRWGFNVTDTGLGISAESQQYVFESFRQVEGVATREHGGIGLGLAIVKSLVGLMGGDISLSSELGKGTAFTVTLPFEPVKEKK